MGGTWRRVRKTASPACGKSATLVSFFGAVYGGVNESVASICSGGSVLAVADGTTMQVWDASSGRGSGHMSSNDRSDRTSQFSTVRCGPSGRYFSAIVARPQSRGVHGEPLDTSKTARLWDMSRSAPVGTLAFEDADGMERSVPMGNTSRLLIVQRLACGT